MSFLGQLGGTLGSVAGNAGEQLLKSLVGTLVCNWFPENSVARYVIGLQGPITERHTMLRAETAMTITSLKSDMELQGAKFTTQAENKRADPTGRLPTVLAAAIILQKKGAPLGQLDMSTFEEAIAVENIPLYTDIKSVLHAKFRRFFGFDDSDTWAWGFKNGSYPGPVFLNVGDELQLVLMGSDNYENPKESFAGNKGYITGTISWMLSQQLQQPQISAQQVI